MITAEAVKRHLDLEQFFTAELGSLRPGRNGNAQALCPFHDDRTPSLSVNLNSGLWQCFGCGETGDVFAFYQKHHNCDFTTALQELAQRAGLNPDEAQPGEEDRGLTLAEFAAAKKLPVDFLTQHGVGQAGRKKRRPYLVFQYRGLDGKLIPEATRMRFSMSKRPKAKRDGKLAVFGLWRIPEMLAEDGEILILEGESDALTAWLYGLPALGLPGKTVTQLLDPAILDGFKTVYVWQEPDAKNFPVGVAKALPGFTVKRMIPPEGIKDLSEAHVCGLDVLDLVRGMQREAVEVIGESSEESGLIITASALLSSKYEETDEVFANGILPAGGGLILSGESGDGKSLLRLQMAICLATGTDGIGLKIPNQRRVLIIQTENTLREEAYRLRRMLAGLGIHPHSIGNLLMFSDPILHFNLADSDNIAKLNELIYKSRANVVIYDPLTSFHNVNENDNVLIRGILDTVTNLNRKLNVTSIIIHHFGKPTELRNNAYRTRGASSIRDWADTLITLTREKHEQKILRRLEFVKVRHGPEPKPILLERDEFFLHHPTEYDMLCPPEKVREIVQNNGGKVQGYETLKQLISQAVNCSPRSAQNFIKAALDRGMIKAETDPYDKRKKVFSL